MCNNLQEGSLEGEDLLDGLGLGLDITTNLLRKGHELGDGTVNNLPCGRNICVSSL